MGAISDFLKSLKDRLTSPFISSFIISWILFNWKVSVALLWYDREQLGKTTLFDFIENNTNNLNSIVYPLLVAFGYTFVYPVFRTFISAFQTFILKWEENWTLNISKGQKIPIEKYFKLREDYLDNSKKLEQIILEEGTDRQKVIEAENKRLDLLKEIERLTTSISKYEIRLKSQEEKLFSFRDVHVLDGQWIFNFKKANEEKQMNLEIKGGTVSVVKDNGERLKAYTITSFFHDTHNNSKEEIFFIKMPVTVPYAEDKYIPKTKRSFFATSLTYEFEQWKGSENNEYEVTYKRPEQSFLPPPPPPEPARIQIHEMS